jgi:hypothetical protein
VRITTEDTSCYEFAYLEGEIFSDFEIHCIEIICYERIIHTIPLLLCSFRRWRLYRFLYYDHFSVYEGAI